MKILRESWSYSSFFTPFSSDLLNSLRNNYNVNMIEVVSLRAEVEYKSCNWKNGLKVSHSIKFSSGITSGEKVSFQAKPKKKTAR